LTKIREEESATRESRRKKGRREGKSGYREQIAICTIEGGGGKENEQINPKILRKNEVNRKVHRLEHRQKCLLFDERGKKIKGIRRCWKKGEGESKWKSEES